MGIENRDYYREDWQGGESPGRWGAVPWLILATSGLFLLFQLLIVFQANEALHFWVETFWLTPWRVVKQFRVWQLVSMIFCHGSAQSDFFRVLFDMLFLWWFGKELESVYGKWRFLRFYLAAGVFASIAFVAGAYLRGMISFPACGSSGAVMGLVILYAFHFPRRQILFMGILPVSMRLLAALYVLFDLLLVSGPSDPTGVTSASHMGGALYAALYWYAFRGGEREGPSLRGLFPRPSRLRLVRKPEDQVDTKTRKEVDRILAKISREGMDSLDPREKEFLEKASRKYSDEHRHRDR